MWILQMLFPRVFDGKSRGFDGEPPPAIPVRQPEESVLGSRLQVEDEVYPLSVPILGAAGQYMIGVRLVVMHKPLGHNHTDERLRAEGLILLSQRECVIFGQNNPNVPIMPWHVLACQVRH